MSGDIFAVMQKLHFEGNIIPMAWFNRVTFENGKPDTNAILLLSDIVYWYRPVVVRDEHSGQVLGYRKKFKADLLQKSYQDYESLFGFSKKQIREAFIRLENLGLIRRIVRMTESSYGLQNNMMFIELFPEKLVEITHRLVPVSFEGGGSFPVGKGVVPLKEPRGSLEGMTYKKEITSEITTEITTRSDARADVSQKMLEVWNDTLQPSPPVQMTGLRHSGLKQVLGHHFAGDVTKWCSFCKEISQSSFLMGKGQRGWKVTLDWILEADNLIKVLEGNYRNREECKDTGESSVPCEREIREKVALHLLELPCDHRRWSEALISRIGYGAYLSWFTGVKIVDVSGSEALLDCCSRFKRDYISTHFSEAVLESLCIVFGNVQHVVWQVREGIAPTPEHEEVLFRRDEKRLSPALSSPSDPVLSCSGQKVLSKVSAVFGSCPSFSEGAEKEESQYREAPGLSLNSPGAFLHEKSQAPFSEWESGR